MQDRVKGKEREITLGKREEYKEALCSVIRSMIQEANSLF